MRLKRCYHEGKTKMKLVARASASRYGRRQYFEMRKCCAHCGCEIK